MLKTNKINGDKGEILSSQNLTKKGYKILETNFKNKIGEIDIIAFKNGCYVFIEVKKRETKLFGRPCEAVDYKKQQKIRKVALSYLKFKKLLDVECRFDVIEILGDDINHIENCF